MDQLDEIKAKVDIVEFIGQYLPLKKAGRNFRTVCPFHGDKDPSLIVSPDKQIWHCFGCGAGGDIFGFLMKKEGLEFTEALGELAERAGVELKTRPRDWGVKSKLLAINELSAKFFEKYMADTVAGRQAMNYLINRGVAPETITKFRLGYAPAGWDFLFKFLRRKEFTPEEIEKAGLIVNRNGKQYDKFRHRLMFPITDVGGRVVGFTGRVLDNNDQPKYLNSPETPIFNKGRILYGLSVTKESIQEKKTVVLVEGQMDALSSYQAGVTNVVASSGTALTLEQLDILRRHAETLILALDADGAGSEATKRVIELASAKDLEIKIAVLEGFKDPDECAKADPAKWRATVAAAIPIVDFYISYATKKYGTTSVNDKKKVVAEVLPAINLLGSPVEKDQYVKKLSETLGISQTNLYEALKNLEVKRKPNKIGLPKGEIKPADRTDWLEKRILGILTFRPNYWEKVQSELNNLKWPHPFTEKVYAELKNCYTGREFSLDGLLAKLDYQEKVDLLETLMTTEEYYADMPEKDVEQELKFYINLLKQRQTKLTLAELNRQIIVAEQMGDAVKLQEFLEEFNRQF
ncbi:MAG: DNA primase [Patescibacteria group bacterium]|jgi:DNA primase